MRTALVLTGPGRRPPGPRWWRPDPNGDAQTQTETLQTWAETPWTWIETLWTQMRPPMESPRPRWRPPDLDRDSPRPRRRLPDPDGDPYVDRMTDICKNIILPQTLFAGDKNSCTWSGIVEPRSLELNAIHALVILSNLFYSLDENVIFLKKTRVYSIIRCRNIPKRTACFDFQFIGLAAQHRW